MRAYRGTAIVVGVLLGFVLLAVGIHPVGATGGVDWKVKVNNNTDQPITVALYVALMDKDGHDKLQEEKYIAAGSSYTFHTGAACPFYLHGAIGGNEIKHKCINGAAFPLCGAACWNTEWKICFKGTGDEIQEYSFCKN